jgi:hypothetical protein
MYTWRYHLLTLVAVFLALGLGLLGGIGLSDSGVVETGNAGLVSDIQRDLDNLNQLNNDLNRLASENQRYQDDTFPYLVSGQLQGLRYAVVASGTVSDQVLRELGSAINSAGGQITSTTRLNSRFDASATTDRLRAAAQGDPAFTGLDQSTLTTLLGPQMAADIGAAGGTALLDALRGTLVDSTNGSYITPVNAVILINRADDQQSPQYADLEKQLLLALRGIGVRPVAAETVDAPISEIPLFINVDVSSVDNIDSRIGQVSMIHILKGEQGSFGVKTTADLLIPILKQPVQEAPAT